jgi:hypothetical protein
MKGVWKMVNSLGMMAVAIGLLAAAPEPIQWESNYGKALRETRASDARPLLVVLDKSTMPEEQVEPALLATDDFASDEAELVRPYERCHVDVSTEYGQRVAKAFGAEQFPFTAIIDKTGSVILHTQAGSVDAEQWKATLVTFRDGERPTQKEMVTFQKPVVSSGSSRPYCASCQRGS